MNTPVGTCWIVGTVYFLSEPGSLGATPLIYGSLYATGRVGNDLQLFQGRFDVGKLQKDGLVWDFLVVEHQADLPYSWREADVLGTGQVVKNNYRSIRFCHRLQGDYCI